MISRKQCTWTIAAEVNVWANQILIIILASNNYKNKTVTTKRASLGISFHQESLVLLYTSLIPGVGFHPLKSPNSLPVSFIQSDRKTREETQPARSVWRESMLLMITVAFDLQIIMQPFTGLWGCCSMGLLLSTSETKWWRLQAGWNPVMLCWIDFTVDFRCCWVISLTTSTPFSQK